MILYINSIGADANNCQTTFIEEVFSVHVIESEFKGRRDLSYYDNLKVFFKEIVDQIKILNTIYFNIPGDEDSLIDELIRIEIERYKKNNLEISKSLIFICQSKHEATQKMLGYTEYKNTGNRVLYKVIDNNNNIIGNMD